MISIVIPLYNKSHTIIGTLESALNQTYSDLELIIVNDGSTDSGINKIQQHIKDPRVRIIEQTNQGVSAARNKGVAEAKNELIAFLDGDDLWLPDYLEKMTEAIKRFPNAGLYCGAGLIKNADGTEIKRLAKKYKGRIVEIDFFENPHVFLHTSATIVTKTAFYNAGEFPIDMKRNEDFALFYSIALISKVVYCAIPLSIYVGGIEGQASSDSSSKIQMHIIQRFNYIFEKWAKSGCSNTSFKIFFKYELRHYFINALRRKDYILVKEIFENLNQGIINLFGNIEIFLISKKLLNKVSILYLLATKMRWRIRGYPRTS